MNTKLLIFLSVFIFAILLATYSWNSDLTKVPQLGQVDSLDISRGSLLGSQSVSLDEKGKVTATLTTYAGSSTTHTKTGLINESQRSSIIVATLAKHGATTMESDPVPPPDTEQTTIQFRIADKKYAIRCSVPKSRCNKLADELFKDFTQILTQQ